MDVLTELLLFFPRLRPFADHPVDKVIQLELSHGEMIIFAHTVFRNNELDFSRIPPSPSSSKIRIEDVVAWIEFSLL